MENFLVSVRCITPVLLTMCLGIWIRSWKLVPDEAFRQLSAVCFHGLLPIQLFYNTCHAELTGTFSPKPLLFLMTATLLWFLFSYVLFTLREPDRRLRGTYIQNAIRSNIAIVGISLAQIMMGPEGVTLMTIAVAVMVPTYNVLAVITLESCRGGHVSAKETVGLVLKNPLIRGCALGALLLLLGIRLPQSVDQAVKNIGSAGSTMTLVALGASLQLGGMWANARKILFCNIYRLLLTPLVFVLTAIALGFRGDSLGVILLCAGAPIATSSYPMAIACDSDHELTAQVVVTTSLFFCLSMLFWIFILRQLAFL